MNKVSDSLYAVFGGTFDPIHYGHLKSVEALAFQLKLSQVIIMPNNVPPHRPQPLASSTQREEMVKLAIAGNPLFTLDDRELKRTTPSYTVEALEQLRATQGLNRPLAFIIGQDSLLNLQHWHRWEEILSLCHLLVCQRPGYPVEMKSQLQQQWLEKHRTLSVDALHHHPAGKIFLATTPLYNISATAIRRRIKENKPCDMLIPPAVLAFIHQHHLYR